MASGDCEDHYYVDYEEGEDVPEHHVPKHHGQSARNNDMYDAGGVSPKDYKSHHRGKFELTEQHAFGVAKNFNVPVEVVYEAHQRGHHLNQHSLHWMHASMQVDIPKKHSESFPDWFRKVAEAADRRNISHPQIMGRGNHQNGRSNAGYLEQPTSIDRKRKHACAMPSRSPSRSPTITGSAFEELTREIKRIKNDLSVVEEYIEIMRKGGTAS